MINSQIDRAIYKELIDNDIDLMADMFYYFRVLYDLVIVQEDSVIVNSRLALYTYKGAADFYGPYSLYKYCMDHLYA